MKICVVGAGAIGGLIGARIAANKQVNVSALARGETLDALCRYGWRLEQQEGVLQTRVTASDNAASLGVQDVVIVALKAPDLPDVLPLIQPLLGDHTLVVSAMNGVPWWFCRDMELASGEPFQSVNPNWVNSKAVAYDNTAGAVVHVSATRLAPGIVKHIAGNRIILGESKGGKSQRMQTLVDILTLAGFDAVHSDNIRTDIWYKLWGNMTMNPVSAITGATADRILADPLVRSFCSSAMKEAAQLGALIGCVIEESVEQRHQSTAKLGAFKTSMLQDVENNRTIELDGIVGVVYEIGQRLNIDTPNIEALFGLTRLFARTKGLYPD